MNKRKPSPVGWLAGVLLLAAVISRPHGLPDVAAGEMPVRATAAPLPLTPAPTHNWSISGLRLGMSKSEGDRFPNYPLRHYQIGYKGDTLEEVAGYKLLDGKRVVLGARSTQKEVDETLRLFPPVPAQGDWHGYKLGEGSYLYEHENKFPGMTSYRAYVLHLEPVGLDEAPDSYTLHCKLR